MAIQSCLRLGNFLKPAESHRCFPFSQVDLKVELRSPVGFLRHAVLADEHEEREEYRFEGYGRRRQIEWKRIEWSDAWQDVKIR